MSHTLVGKVKLLYLRNKNAKNCSRGTRLATRVHLVAFMAFMMMQQRTDTICNPKLIAIFERLEKKLKGQSDCKAAKFYNLIA